jgi:hypothetical protein
MLYKLSHRKSIGDIRDKVMKMKDFIAVIVQQIIHELRNRKLHVRSTHSSYSLINTVFDCPSGVARGGAKGALAPPQALGEGREGILPPPKNMKNVFVAVGSSRRLGGMRQFIR